VASFFEPSINGIIDVVNRQVAETTDRIPTPFFVAGFAASSWLYSCLQARLQPHGMGLCRPHNHKNNAVAGGVVSFSLGHFVSVHTPKVAYGICRYVTYHPTNPEHVLRRGRIETQPCGRLALPDSFSILLRRGARVRESDEIELGYFRQSLHSSKLDRIAVDIICYRLPYHYLAAQSYRPSQVVVENTRTVSEPRISIWGTT